MKHLVTRLIALMAFLLPVTASAYNFMVDGLAYDINDDGISVSVAYEATIYFSDSNYSGLTEANIPETVTYNGITYSVTSIGFAAFGHCRGLTSVTIPNSVKTIGNNAFRECIGLTSVTIPNSVTSIGTLAFFNCSGLTSVTIPNSVTSIGEKFINCAFGGCTGLKTIKVESGNVKYDSRDDCNAIIETASNTLIAGCKNTTIPNSVTSIGCSAFEGCTSLTGVTIPNSVTSIDYNAFEDCTGLTSVTIPNSVTSIGECAFRGCTGLTSITIGNSVTSIDELTFERCIGLTSVTIPNSVKTIGNNAFRECSGLTSVTIPNSVTSIGSFAFCGCSGLTSVTIGNSVTSIGSHTFLNCRGLTSVTIPNSVKTIGNDAFGSCSGLRNIYSYIQHPENVTLGNSVFGNVPKDVCSLHVPRSTVNLYRSCDQWKDFTNIFDDLEITTAIPGDMDGSGLVDVDDVNAMINVILFYDQYKDQYLGNADFDGNGIVDVDDVNALINIILNN